jgi:hypothetical protein
MSRSIRDEAYLCPIWKWDGTAVLLVFKFPQDTGTGSDIVSIKGFLAFGDLDRPPRDDEPVALKANMHVVLFDPWQVKNGRHS